MPKSFKSGDVVSWNTPQGQTFGKVIKKITDKGSISEYTINASSNNTQYKVESGSSGKIAAHKPESLRHE